MSADTWLGAAGCASGSQTWSGTRPAFVPKPTRANANRSVAGSARAAAERGERLEAERPGRVARA